MRQLFIIKILHTLIWIFFNILLFYMAYEAITGNITKGFWIGLSLFAIEGIVLLTFNNHCPLTILAKKYSDSTKNNFDIFLPEWLAKNNKLIYTILLGIVVAVMIYRVVVAGNQ